MDERDALFTQVGTDFLPGLLTTGPWRRDAQHGGPVGALVAHACERVIDADSRVGSLTLLLTRPVPLAPLRVEVDTRTLSRRVTELRASVVAAESDETVCEATALVLRGSTLPEPLWQPSEAAKLPPAEQETTVADAASTEEGPAYHRDAVEFRAVSGVIGEPGPADVWMRLRHPVVAGHRVSSLERMMAAADFGSGISAIYPFGGTTALINPTVHVAVVRPLVGDWVRLTATTRLGPDGIGLASSMLGDEEGVVATSTQSVIGWNPT